MFVSVNLILVFLKSAFALSCANTMFTAGLQRALHQIQGSISRAQFGCDCNNCDDSLPVAIAMARQQAEAAAEAAARTEAEPQTVLCEEAHADEGDDVS